MHPVAPLVLGHQAGHRAPGADVVPGEGGGEHHQVAAGLHHGVVDGDVLGLAEGFGRQLRELRLVVLRDLAPALGHALCQLGPVLGQLGQQGVGAHAEHAAVPQEIAAFQIPAGRRSVRLFDEALDLAGIAVREPGARLDVAIARLGGGGPDAEGHQLALCRQPGGFFRFPQELFDRGDEVVGRQHQHHGLGRHISAHPVGSRGDRSRRVAAHRLQQVARPDAAGGAQRAADLVFRDEVVVAVGDQQDLLGGRGLGRALHGPPQQRVAVRQLHEGLGMAFAGHRPQARAGAAGQDDGDHQGGLGFVRFQGVLSCVCPDFRKPVLPASQASRYASR